MTDIIITGAGKGIGFELAKYFAGLNGYRVIGLSRNIDQLKTFQTKNLISVSVDLAAPDASNTIQELIELHNLKPSILINNAGLLINKPFVQLRPEDFDRLFATNVKAAFILTQQLMPHFRPNAHIVNIGSMGGFQGSAKFAGLSLYSASKGALSILSECLAEELKDTGIAVNCLALGAAQTEMLQQAFPGYKAPVTASEMASFIAEFAINGNRYFNGKILPVSLSTP
jgi:NAD(P)-dependent dehydrogenase (short-subunit alcohol dehydrogenase family)